MKKKVTLLALICLCAFPVMSQRQIDLTTVLITPEQDQYIPPGESFSIQASVYNSGTEIFNDTDSMAVYLLINGDTLTIQPGNITHTNHTHITLQQGEFYPIALMDLTFDVSYEGMSVEICVYARPFNSTDPITDPNPGLDLMACATVHVMEAPVSGLDESTAGDPVLYPNPAKDVVTIESASEIRSVAGIDAMGNAVNVGFSGSAIDCGQLENGIYFFSIETASGTFRRRVVIAD